MVALAITPLCSVRVLNIGVSLIVLKVFHKQILVKFEIVHNDASTGKSLSEALIFAEHRKNMLCTEIVLNFKISLCTQHVLLMF